LSQRQFHLIKKIRESTTNLVNQFYFILKYLVNQINYKSFFLFAVVVGCWVLEVFVATATILVVVRCSGDGSGGGWLLGVRGVCRHSDDSGGGSLLRRRFWWWFVVTVTVVLVVICCSGDGSGGADLLRWWF
jgi:hypothetical protein